MPEFRFSGTVDGIPSDLRPSNPYVGAALVAAPISDADGSVKPVGEVLASTARRDANLEDLDDKNAGRLALNAVSIFNVEVNVKDYIPTSDNHTTAVRRAIDELTARGGGKLKVPRGPLFVQGFPGEKQIFRITVPIILEGEGPLQSQILALDGTPTDCDIFLWEPSAIGFYYGINNIFIGPAGLTQGGNALSIKTSASAYLENPFIENSWLWGANGYGIYQESTAATGAGTVHQMVMNRTKLTGKLGGGKLTACGDNFSAHDCGVSGDGRGLTVVATSGTARVTISCLNSRAMTGGAVKLVGCDQAQLIGGQYEQFQPFVGPADEQALIVLDNCTNTKIDVSANGFGNIENCLLLKNNTRGTRAGKQTFNNSANPTTGDKWHITMAAGCGPDNIFDNIDYIYNGIGDVVRFRNQSTAVATHQNTKNISGRITRSYGPTRVNAEVFDGVNSAYSWVIAGSERLIVNVSALYPAADNSMALGGPVNRYAQLYAATTTINTSDAREKTEIVRLTASEIAAAQDLAREIGSFRFLAAVAEKDDGARRHIGMTVQRAIEIMQSHGLDPFGYAFICHDSWPAQEALYEDALDAAGQPAVERRLAQEAVHEAVFTEGGRATGNTMLVQEAVYEPDLDENHRPIPIRRLVRPALAAGDLYGFRTDQMLLFIAAGLEARLSALEADRLDLPASPPRPHRKRRSPQ